MSLVVKQDRVEERAYQAYLGHTVQCATCRVGAPCGTAARLGRAWREARR